MRTRLEGRVALVTGGTGGIGAAICKQLADSGAKVATNYRNEEKAQKWLAETQAQGYDFKIYQIDVADFDACKELVARIEQHLLGLHHELVPRLRPGEEAAPELFVPPIDGRARRGLGPAPLDVRVAELGHARIARVELPDDLLRAGPVRGQGVSIVRVDGR